MSMSLQHVLDRGRWLLAVAAAAAAFFFCWAGLVLPSLPEDTPARPGSFEWPEVRMPAPEHWEVLQGRQSLVSQNAGPLAQRFRLAGTFFAYGDAEAGHPEYARRAILDDMETRQQHLLGEHDRLGDIEVVSIFHDRVILRVQGQEEQLWLSFAGGTAPRRPAPPGPARAPTPAEEAILESSRFGKRVGERRWVFQRDALLSYYQELLDDPERLAAVYLSLKPDRGTDGRIKGYYLGTEGEADFFKAVGLHEGDIIRTVNSIRMTSQARAEYFITEFVKNRLSACVLEVERGGKPAEKFVYLIR